MITITLVDGSTLDAIYVEEAFETITSKRKMSIRLAPNTSHTLEEISAMCTEANLASISIDNGKVQKTVTNLTKVDSLVWRLTDSDAAAENALHLSEA